MERTDSLQSIHPKDQWILDESGALVGVRNPKGGADLRPPQFGYDASGNITSLVSGDREYALTGTYTWEQMIALTPIEGATAICSDLRSQLFVYDGGQWRAMGALKMSSGLPMIVPSSGSIADNGALTLTTALPRIYAACYMVFPANAIAAGSTAGTYYVEMSSTTVGIIYGNTHSTVDAAQPTIPSTKTALVTTGPGAYTQNTTTQAILTLNVPAKLMGAYGTIRTQWKATVPNNANAKNVMSYFGNSGLGTQMSTTLCANLIAVSGYSSISNSGVENIQVGDINNTNGYGTSNSQNVLRGAIDTATVRNFFRLCASLANAADFIVIESHLVEIVN